MKRLFLIFSLIVLLGFNPPKVKKPHLAVIGSDSTTIQEDAGGAVLTHPVVVVSTNNQPLTVDISTTVKCCSSGNQVSNNFTVTVRMDGTAIKTQNFSLADMGYDYQYVPIAWSMPVNNPGNGTHTFDVRVDSGGWMVVIFSSPTAPTFMNIYQ